MNKWLARLDDREVASTRIAIQEVLENASEELFSLGGRLQDVEKILFDASETGNLKNHQQEMQDMDLIIQQICDLARAIRLVSQVELEDAMLATSTLGDTLHLNDLRQRLLGLAEDRLLTAPKSSAEVLLF